MKHIVKGGEPASLANWKQGQINAGIPPVWGDYSNPEKEDGRQHLLAEQGSICCYCNKAISSPDMHIEHFQTRTAYPNLQLDWNNLLGCCAPQNLKKRLKSQSHCGEYRGHAALPLGPLSPNCETQFCYELLGQIRAAPSTNVLASDVLNVLNLHAERLLIQRKRLIEAAYADIEELSEEEWLEIYVGTHGSNLPEFSAMMDWFYRNGWDQELQAAADDAF